MSQRDCSADLNLVHHRARAVVTNGSDGEQGDCTPGVPRDLDPAGKGTEVAPWETWSGYLNTEVPGWSD